MSHWGARTGWSYEAQRVNFLREMYKTENRQRKAAMEQLASPRSPRCDPAMTALTSAMASPVASPRQLYGVHLATQPTPAPAIDPALKSTWPAMSTHSQIMFRAHDSGFIERFRVGHEHSKPMDMETVRAWSRLPMGLARSHSRAPPHATCARAVPCVRCAEVPRERLQALERQWREDTVQLQTLMRLRSPVTGGGRYFFHEAARDTPRGRGRACGGGRVSGKAIAWFCPAQCVPFVRGIWQRAASMWGNVTVCHRHRPRAQQPASHPRHKKAAVYVV